MRFSRTDTCLHASLLLIGLAVGCSRATLPDPKDTVDEYCAAVRRGDVGAIHAMLDERSQRAFGKEGVARRVHEARAELLRRAEAASGKTASVSALAELRFSDGEVALLVAEHGRFAVQAAGVLPAGARSPAEALAELRRALARRSYSALTRVLSDESRRALEQDVGSLVQGLESPQTLEVRVDGDSAEVEVTGGHWVRLKREAGVWRVKDFD